MTTLKFVMTIINICDGDKNPNLRHKYTIEDMILAHKICELGNNVADVKFYSKLGKGRIQLPYGLFCECGRKVEKVFERCECEEND